MVAENPPATTKAANVNAAAKRDSSIDANGRLEVPRHAKESLRKA
jgi:hypothetical protein